MNFLALNELGISVSGTLNPPYDIVVPLSGGKDSQACLKLALKTRPEAKILALFCDTQFEHELTYAHIARITTDYGVDLIKLCAGSVLEKCTKYKRFPGGGARHCTDELKLRPSKFFYRELSVLQGGFEVWLGMRSDESKEREKRYRFTTAEELTPLHELLPGKFPKYLFERGVIAKLPVLDWSKSEIFEFLEGEENPLYGFGFDRVGCFPCLAGGEFWQVKAFNFDDTGRKHFKIAQEISVIAGRPVLVTKKFGDQGPGCAICSM